MTTNQLEPPEASLAPESPTPIPSAIAVFSTGLPMPTPPSSTPGGDPTKLRGIPVVGSRIPGAVRGSLPHVEIVARDPRTFRRRLLSRQANGIDETIAGTQPEQKTLETHGDWPQHEATAAEVERGPRTFDERPKPADGVG